MVSPALKRNADHLSATGADKKKPKGGSITSFFGAPKPKPLDAPGTAAPARPSSFNKEKWVASLTPEQKELLQLEIDTLDESWLAHLKDEIVTTEFLNLKRFLKKEKDSKTKVFPPEEDVYSWFAPLHVSGGFSVGLTWPGPGIRLYTRLRLSLSAKTRITITTRPMGWRSRCDLLLALRHH